MKLLEVYNQILLEQEQNPNVFYHGTNHSFDLSSLDITRDSLKRNATGGVNESASERDGKGLYVTKALWKQGAQNSDTGDYFKKPVYVGIPSYSEGHCGSESAEKYAIPNRDDTGNIYRIILKDDFRFEKYGYEGVNGRNVVESGMRKLLSMGVDGLITDTEAVLLNKEKIKSVDLAYKAEGYNLGFRRIDFSKATSWGDLIRDTQKDGHIYQTHSVVTSKENEEKLVAELLGNTFAVGKQRNGDKIYINISQELYECINWYGCDAAKRVEMHKKLPIDSPNLRGLYVDSHGHNWVKQI